MKYRLLKLLFLRALIINMDIGPVKLD